MSWSAQFTRPVLKIDIEQAIEALYIARPDGRNPGQPGYTVEDAAADDQLQAAKKAALVLAWNLAGPYIMVSVSGHANAVGWHKKSAYVNDMISLHVIQVCEEDLKYYSA